MEEIDGTTGNALSGYALDASEDGTALLLWARGLPQSSKVVFYSRYTPSLGWSSPSPVVGDYAYGEHPSVVMGADGTAIAAWTGSADHRLDAAWFDPATGWGAPTTVFQNSGGTNNYVRNISLAVGGDASAIVAWNVGPVNEAMQEMWFAHRPAGGPWGPAERFEPTNPVDQHTPVVAMDAQGNGILAWRYNYGQNVYVKKYRASSGWELGSTKVDEPVINHVQSLSVSMAPDGRAIVVWAQKPTAEYTAIPDVWANSMDADGTWSGAVSLESRTVKALGPGVRMNPDGAAMVTWYEDGGYDHVPVVSRLGGVWQTPVMADSNENHAFETFTSALSSNGSAVVVWKVAGTSTTPIKLYFARSTDLLTWSPPALIVSHQGTLTAPVMDMDAEGNAFLAFAIYINGYRMQSMVMHPPEQ